MLFKKGDKTLPENYRPISLLPVGYKIIAWMIQKRLRKGGAEQRIRSSQFGFRQHRSTSDAISILLQIFDAAYEATEPGLTTVLLDWAKAFDRLKTDTMIESLRRFGIFQNMLVMISSIYEVRNFQMADCEGPDKVREQFAGIAQGCPLSPYLFIMVQTVLMHDVDERLLCEAPVNKPAYLVTTDLVYADDTALLSSCSVRLQLHLNILVEEGKKYGLELNWDKTMVIGIHSTGKLYLGGIIANDMSARPELTRRLGLESREHL